jgi:hypothetical protein
MQLLLLPCATLVTPEELTSSMAGLGSELVLLLMVLLLLLLLLCR